MAVPDEARQCVRHGDFYQDPEANPLHTESGKIEIFCAAFDRFKPEGFPAIPKFLEPAEYLGNAEEGQLHVVSPHPYMRLHSQMARSEEHTSELQSRGHLVCRLLLEKNNEH